MHKVSTQANTGSTSISQKNKAALLNPIIPAKKAPHHQRILSANHSNASIAATNLYYQ